MGGQNRGERMNEAFLVDPTKKAQRPIALRGIEFGALAAPPT